MPITCPKCGRKGYLQRYKSKGNIYLRVKHPSKGKTVYHYLGRGTRYKPLLKDVIEKSILSAIDKYVLAGESVKEREWRLYEMIARLENIITWSLKPRLKLPKLDEKMLG